MQALMRGCDEPPRRLDLTPVDDNAGLAVRIAEPAADARSSAYLGSSLPYAVSKAALNHLTTILAKHAQRSARANAFAPGLVATPWTEGCAKRKAAWELIASPHHVA